MIRLGVSKTRWLCPSEAKPARFRASLFSPAERNHARSALKRFSQSLSLIITSISPVLINKFAQTELFSQYISTALSLK